MLKEFKAFIMKGNVLELAVAVIIAGAFGAIVKSLTADVIMPPIGLALGGVDFSSLAIVLQEGVSNDAGELVQEEVAIRYGIFHTADFGLPDHRLHCFHDHPVLQPPDGKERGRGSSTRAKGAFAGRAAG
jgi:hypothetical protein